MTTFTLAQAHATADANPSAATLGSAPTAGNLLVLMATERSGTGHAAYTFPDEANWTKVIGHDNDLTNPNTRCNLAVWIKKAGASEATSHSVDNGTANAIRTILMELQPSAAVATYTVPSGGTSSQGTGADTAFVPPLSTGSTSSLPAGDYLILTVGALRNGFSITATAWSNTPDVEDFEGGATGNERVISYGFKDDAAGGAYSADFDWTSSSNDSEGIASIAVIEIDAGGGGGGQPFPPSLHRRQTTTVVRYR